MAAGEKQGPLGDSLIARTLQGLALHGSIDLSDVVADHHCHDGRGEDGYETQLRIKYGSHIISRHRRTAAITNSIHSLRELENHPISDALLVLLMILSHPSSTGTIHAWCGHTDATPLP